MSKTVIDVAKECNIPAKELMSFLRERSVDAKNTKSVLSSDAIEKVYDFYGTPKSVIKARENAANAAAHKRVLYDANGNVIKRQYDENGKLIPIKEPVFDENGKQLVMKKAPIRLFDANGNEIKRQYDENGKLIPIKEPVFDENGKQLVMKKKPAKNEEAKTDEKEASVSENVRNDNPKETVEEKTVETVKEEDVSEPALPVAEVNNEAEKTVSVTEAKEKPGVNALPKRDNKDFEKKSPREDKRNDFKRKDDQKGDFKRKDGKTFENRDKKPGERSYNKDGQRPNRDGKPFENKSFDGKKRFDKDGQRPNRDGGFGKGGNGFGAGFDKDKDAGERKSFTKKNERSSSSSSLKNELGKDISRDQRAAAFNERKKDKANKKNRDFENEDGLKKPKKKDPNRKGAFIMPKPVAKKEEDPNEIKTIVIPEVITIKELADKLKQNASNIVKKLFLSGKMVSINSEITFEEAEEIALEYECIAEKEQIVDVVEELMKDIEDPEDTLVERPPVICVMGHVDHGKTSILDAIRNTNVTSREAGGITQHIGAYQVEINGKKITFLDTPGHEAFTAMRLRGAMSTDIAILVVAADDGVMPQTVEAISHAKAAGVSIVVAINKMDREGANPDKVMAELSEHGLTPVSWGGSTEMVPVSAKKGEGIEDLLETILLEAELLELKANPNRNGRGLVIDAKLDKGRGPVATVLVKKGTLRVGDNIAIGSAYGKVRAMINERGINVKEATPSMPVEILGLNTVPNAGDEFVVTKTDKEARTIAEAFIAQGKEKLIAETKAKLSLDGLFDQIQAGNVKELNIIIKADVQGSVEAVKNALIGLSNEEVAVRVIHSGAGNINESDVTLAGASNAIIIGFNVKPDNAARESAEKEKVDLRLYNVIYNAIDDIEAAMNGMLDPVYEEKVIGHAEIRQIFKASGVGNIAGSYITDGKAVRNSKIRIYRREELIHEGELASLKRFKDDVKEVAAGYECGLVFDKFGEFIEGDTVEFYVLEEVPRSREKKQY
ncbi:MAG: translation initiation factor IF-2 [Clostridiales bacterium]|nr:translation initiation factor IF-2 [Clostridiales bacterium]